MVKKVVYHGPDFSLSRRTMSLYNQLKVTWSGTPHLVVLSEAGKSSSVTSLSCPESKKYSDILKNDTSPP